MSGFSLSLFIDIQDWAEAKHNCKPFSAAVESPDAKEMLAIISTEVVRNCVS